MGELLGRERRADELTNYALQAISRVKGVVSNIPHKEWIPVYYAEGADGLYSECEHSLHVELISKAGGANICRCQSENLLGWNGFPLSRLCWAIPPSL